MEEWQNKKALEEILAHCSKKSLFNLISWLDVEIDRESDGHTFPLQTLARSVAALGYAIEEKNKSECIYPTTKAAEIYALEPIEENWDKFYDYATSSYPFGPGDGCYSVAETGYPQCEIGSGCYSGSGCLYHIGIDDFTEKEIVQIIAKELNPWLRGEGDPVAIRRACT